MEDEISSDKKGIKELRVHEEAFFSALGHMISLKQRDLLYQHLFQESPKGRPLIWDSRELPDEPSIFFAIRGDRFDPAPHLNGWLKAGHVVVTDVGLAQSLQPQFSEFLIGIDKPQSSLAILAESCLDSRVEKLTTLAVTGTNGKTSCTTILAGMLVHLVRRPVAKLGTLGFFDGHRGFENSFPTTPDYPSFCRILNHLVDVGTPFLVMEASSHALALGRLGSWRFDGAILTNLTPDHLDFHGTMDAYWQAKKLLFSRHLKPNAAVAIHCARSPWKELAPDLIQNGHPLALAECPDPLSTIIKSTLEWPLLVSHVHEKAKAPLAKRNDETGLCFEIQCETATDTATTSENILVSAPNLAGQFQTENLSVCLLLCHLLGHRFSAIASACLRLDPIAGRMERINIPAHGPYAPKVYVDYAHSPDALESSLRSLMEERVPLQGLLIVVFGCGGNRDKTKRPIMGQIASLMSDFVIVTSDNPRDEDPQSIVDGIVAGCHPNSKFECILDRELAIKRALALAGPSDIVLIAGKGHENYQIVGGVKYPFSDAGIARKILDEAFPFQSPPRTHS